MTATEKRLAAQTARARANVKRAQTRMMADPTPARQAAYSRAGGALTEAQRRIAWHASPARGTRSYRNRYAPPPVDRWRDLSWGGKLGAWLAARAPAPAPAKAAPQQAGTIRTLFSWLHVGWDSVVKQQQGPGRWITTRSGLHIYVGDKPKK